MDGQRSDGQNIRVIDFIFEILAAKSLNCHHTVIFIVKIHLSFEAMFCIKSFFYSYVQNFKIFGKFLIIQPTSFRDGS